MNVTVSPAPLCGTIEAVSSKSDAHRLLICSALSDAPTTLYFHGLSEDISATARCLTALGAAVEFFEGGCTVSPVTAAPASPLLDCGESGSTLRFLLPVAAALWSETAFTGAGRLPQRPLTELLSALETGGVHPSSHHLPLTLRGRLKSGIYTLSGNVSSQYISGLLLGLSICLGTSEVRVSTPLESAAYVNMTVDALKRFGTHITKTETGWKLTGRARLTSPKALTVEGDWSNAAFFLAAGALEGSVTVTGLHMQSPQGDREILDILGGMGAVCTVTETGVTVSAAPLHGIEADLSQIPDLLPILAVVAAYATGESRFYNGARLRLKESDRLAAAASMLKTLGAALTEHPDALTIQGGKPLTGGTVEGFHDHRMVMSAAIAAAYAAAPVTITDANAVHKSYPAFFADFQALGGAANVL